MENLLYKSKSEQGIQGVAKWQIYFFNFVIAVLVKVTLHTFCMVPCFLYEDPAPRISYAFILYLLLLDYVLYKYKFKLLVIIYI